MRKKEIEVFHPPQGKIHPCLEYWGGGGYNVITSNPKLIGVFYNRGAIYEEKSNGENSVESELIGFVDDRDAGKAEAWVRRVNEAIADRE